MKPDSHYSPATVYGSLIFISGQGPIDSVTGKIIKGTFEEQLKLTLNNIKTILKETGSSLDKVLKTTVYLSNMDNFKKMNQIYKKYFPKNPPARTTIQAGKLFDHIAVEIDAIAYKEK